MNNNDPVVVLGGGPAGLGAAHFLSQSGIPVALLEKEPRVGGMGASVQRGDYQADYGPHTFHLKKSAITDLFNRLVGADCNRVCRDARIWLHGETLPFPLRAIDVATSLNPLLVTKIAADYARERIHDAFRQTPEDGVNSFESWGRRQFGQTLYRLAFGNYSEKMWGLPGSHLSDKLARQKLTGISLKELALSALNMLNSRRAEMIGLSRTAKYDAYPSRGIGVFFEAMAAEIGNAGGRIFLGSRPVDLEIVNGRATAIVFEDSLGRSERLSCRAVISTIPLPNLGRILPDAGFSRAKSAAANIRYRSLCCVHLILNQERFSEAHWIYMLDDRLTGNRLSEQKNLSPLSCPPGKTVVCIDITCDHGDYIWKAEDSFLVGLAISDLKLMGLSPRSIIDAFVMRAEHVYPVYSLGFEKDVANVLDECAAVSNLYSAGRHGLLLNNDMHDSIEMGFLSAQHARDGKPATEWYALAEQYVAERLEGIVRDPIHFEPDSASAGRS